MLRWMLASLLIGGLLVAAGIGVLWGDPDNDARTMTTLITGVSLLTVGGLLLIPAKIYLILRLTRRS